MVYIDKKLLAASKTAGNTIKLSLGEDFTGLFLGYYTKLDERYNKVRYHFKFRLQDGSEKELRSNASKFLTAMAYVQLNAVVKITKTGEGTSTDYNVDIIKEPKTAAQVEPPEATPEPAPETPVTENKPEEDEEGEDPFSAPF